ncbi:5755_t:CDS:2 [Funneliformis geosporum]|uniref:5755_t:CDS:1 n=1 Tax=Funneliformis geosporum TaxID=1117311 RepID=A0A9W4T5R2_9GLOM|nr:5755_t:CDS:2 [Funneliformis geosporum]
MSTHSSCYIPIIRPLFFTSSYKEYNILLNHATNSTATRPDFLCLVNEIPILNSEIKPSGFTPLQQQKDKLKVQLRGRKSINQLLRTNGSLEETVLLTNQAELKKENHHLRNELQSEVDINCQNERQINQLEQDYFWYKQEIHYLNREIERFENALKEEIVELKSEISSLKKQLYQAKKNVQDKEKFISSLEK